MLEDEILTLLTNAKKIYKTHEATSEALGVPRSTFYSWIKDKKGIKDQQLFQALDALGVHLTTEDVRQVSLPNQEGREIAISCHAPTKTTELLKIELLKAKIDSLEKQVKMLSSHNESLERQLGTVNSILSEVVKKKETPDCSIPSGISKIS